MIRRSPRKAGLFLFVLLSACCFVSVGQPNTGRGIFITRDSLSFVFSEDWKFLPGDSAHYASVQCNDSGWQHVSSRMPMDKAGSKSFTGKGWFRLHFNIDSSMVDLPLAIGVKQAGASEIYIDGKLLKSYGKISDSVGSEYYDPQELPVPFTLHEQGSHVIAVRYANYQAGANFSKYRQPKAGFLITIGDSDSFIRAKDFKTMLLSVISISLMGIFTVLTLLHLFLYAFYPVSRSNLYFSIFTGCIAIGCLIGFVSGFSHDPHTQMQAVSYTNFLFCAGSLALSGFINTLFTKKRKISFRIILFLALLSVVLRYFQVSFYGFITVALVISVSIEAVIIIVSALYRRVPGARIIGAGILFLTVFLLTIFTLAILSGGNFDVDDSTSSGRIITIIAAMAILSVPFSMSVYQAWSFGLVNKDLEQQLEQVKVLSQKNLEQEQEKVKLISGQNELLEQKVEERTTQLKAEKKKSDDLLLNILPAEVAEELKQKGNADARLFDSVTVMFTDFVNFTGISEKLSPSALVSEINHCFKAFDEIIEREGLEKIKTIGDAYLAVCGLPHPQNDHAIKTVKAAKAILYYIQQRKAEGGIFNIRIGIHTGPVVAGIVGIKKFAYDIWGDTVNLANRMESSSNPGKINISGATYELVKNDFECTYRGKIPAKNKGDIDMYFVEG